MQRGDKLVLLRWRWRERHECGHCLDLWKWLRFKREWRENIEGLTSTWLIGELHCDDHSGKWWVRPYIILKMPGKICHQPSWCLNLTESELMILKHHWTLHGTPCLTQEEPMWTEYVNWMMPELGEVSSCALFSALVIQGVKMVEERRIQHHLLGVALGKGKGRVEVMDVQQRESS